MPEELYSIPVNPVYDPRLRKLQNSDPGNADTIFNPLFQKIISNLHALKCKLDLDDIDCGFWGEEEVKQVAAHDATPFAHAKLRVDGNVTAGAPGGGNPAATLEAHSMDERAHPDLLLDGNVTVGAGKAETLEEHLRDRAVHGDIVLDGNL